MRRFALAYQDHLYSADGGKDHVVSAYRDAMQAYERLPRWRRALGAVNPASLAARARKYVSGQRARLGKMLRGRAYRTSRKRR
jgi:hypothetical protein